MVAVSRKPSRLREASRAHKRGLVLDAAAQVFASKGYHGASTSDIADEVGMTQSNLYNYFKSKDEALEAICVIATDGYLNRIKEIMAANCSFEERLYRFLLSHLGTIYEKEDTYVTFLTCRQFLPDAPRHRVGALTREYEILMAEMFFQASERKEIAPLEDVTFAVSSLLALCHNIAIPSKGNFGFTVEELAKKIADIFLKGAIKEL